MRRRTDVFTGAVSLLGLHPAIDEPEGMLNGVSRKSFFISFIFWGGKGVPSQTDKSVHESERANGRSVGWS
jgi:hypothetical protein